VADGSGNDRSRDRAPVQVGALLREKGGDARGVRGSLGPALDGR
jgi:hypothetical protein